MLKRVDYLIESQGKQQRNNYDYFMRQLLRIEDELFDRISNSKLNPLMLRQLGEWLKQAGYEHEYKDYVNKVNADGNLAYFKAIGEETALTTLDKSVLSHMKKQMYSSYEVIGAKAVNTVQNYIMGEILGVSTPFKALVAKLRDEIPLKQYAYTYANTSVLQYNREANFRLAEHTDLKYWLYTGASIIKTSRKFCINHFGKYYTKEEIAGMRNGQGTNVSTNAGGWNCRHKWVPLPEIMLKEGGYQRG